VSDDFAVGLRHQRNQVQLFVVQMLDEVGFGSRPERRLVHGANGGAIGWGFWANPHGTTRLTVQRRGARGAVGLRARPFAARACRIPLGMSSSTCRGVTESPAICSSPTQIGSLKRRGPALPGLMNKTPSRVSLSARCECPNTT